MRMLFIRFIVSSRPMLDQKLWLVLGPGHDIYKTSFQHRLHVFCLRMHHFLINSIVSLSRPLNFIIVFVFDSNGCNILVIHFKEYNFSHIIDVSALEFFSRPDANSMSAIIHWIQRVPCVCLKLQH